MAFGQGLLSQHRPLHHTRTRRRLSGAVAVLVVFLALSTESALLGGSWWALATAWAGLMLVMAGIFGRLLATLFIGGHKGAELVRAGPYGVTRNPLYLSSLLATIGLGLASANPLLLLLLLLAFLLYYPGVLTREEEKLARRHGAAYQDYRRAVPRFWPRPGADWREPDWVTASPRQFRMALADAGWFIIAYIALRAIAEAHARGVLPAYTLPF
ncbi:methyltransferase family protein [Thiohalorhabdus sp. Cl-TMA]|uniref:Isoprenylcysteine carboxylmethyltransferase family protein n=1 Tax=Thiohalorhabdus methylotrophus TaxID=3242694 RepID=A0ABV4TW41_9GAMM